MKNWIRYDKNSSSDARRGHLRISKFPNFSKGESFPLWPPLSLRRRRWFSLVGDPRPPTCHLFEREPLFKRFMWFYPMLKASCNLASVSNIYILTLAGAHPKCGSWRHPPKARPKKWRRHRGEKLQLSIFLYFLTRNPIFDLRKSVRVSECSKITIKLFVLSKSKTKCLIYFLFVSLRVFKVSFFQLSQIWCFQSSYFS